jgi:hypothetical protein
MALDGIETPGSRSRRVRRSRTADGVHTYRLLHDHDDVLAAPDDLDVRRRWASEGSTREQRLMRYQLVQGLEESGHLATARLATVDVFGLEREDV